MTFDVLLTKSAPICGSDSRDSALSDSFDILLVEDNADLAGNIVDYLEALGHRLHYAADGDSGLREALVGPVDIVLLDLALPNRDGLSVCAEMRRRADRRVCDAAGIGLTIGASSCGRGAHFSLQFCNP